jgi:hypothetical protein
MNRKKTSFRKLIYFFETVCIAGHWELTDLFVERVKLEPHWTPEGDVGLLRVEDVCSIADPKTFKV